MARSRRLVGVPPPANRTTAVLMPTTTAVAAASATPAHVKAPGPAAVRPEAQPAATAGVRLSAPPARALTPPVAPPPTAAVAADARDVMERARMLAQRADVKTLVALRERVIAGAAERGEQDSAATKQQLDELDRYLAEARALRLKIDALEFRKSAPGTEPSPIRP